MQYWESERQTPNGAKCTEVDLRHPGAITITITRTPMREV